MNTVILVPYRGDGGHRDRVRAYTLARWEREHPTYPIHVGYHLDGRFNRSYAVNRAAEQAGDWDVAVIIDADVLCNADRVREGVQMAADSGRMVLPYEFRRDLSPDGSERIMAGYEGSWERFVKHTWRRLVSNVVVVPRALWDEVQGFDEAFRGWGAEDNAFAESCETFGGPILRLPGDVWHLWHPTNADEGKRSPSYIANAARWARYTAVRGDREAIRALRAEVQVLPEASVGIPRILHRTVPEVTTPEAERWWAAFGDLHPGWTLMTHRDPLDPGDWPLTSPHWHKAANGAQFADMIRLEALLRWGGVYVDQDVQPFRSFEPLLPLQAFAGWENDRCIPNAVMGSVPGHLAIRTCLDTMLTRLPGPTWKAGPGVLTDILPGRSDVLLLPPESFYGVDYRASDRDEQMRTFDPKHHPAAFCLHHYWGSWLEKPTADVA